MKYAPYRIITIVLLLAGFFFPEYCVAQDHAKALAAADTANFSVRKQDGWKLFNSYLNLYSDDTVKMEIIISHNNDLDWNKEQYIGKVKNAALCPESVKNLSYSLNNTTYNIRIKQDGKCYLRLDSGSPPEGDPVVIPIHVSYIK